MAWPGRASTAPMQGYQSTMWPNAAVGASKARSAGRDMSLGLVTDAQLQAMVETKMPPPLAKADTVHATKMAFVRNQDGLVTKPRRP